MVVCCRSLPLTAHPTRACPAGCPASRGAPTLQGCQPTVPYRPRGLRRGCPHPLHDLSCKPPAAAPLALARGIRSGLRCPSAAHAASAQTRLRTLLSAAASIPCTAPPTRLSRRWSRRGPGLRLTRHRVPITTKTASTGRASVGVETTRSTCSTTACPAATRATTKALVDVCA